MRRKSGKKNIQISIRILQAIVLFGFLIMFGRVFQLQIVDFEKYAPQSRENSIRLETVHPARGLILDRNGTILVENQPTYSVMVTPANFDNSKISLLASLLNTDEEYVLEKLSEARQYSWFRSSRMFTDVPFDVFSKLQENNWQLPGIGFQVESKRSYPQDMMASHALGYLREASPLEYEQSEVMRLGDKIGKSGLEMVYEDFLRGRAGSEYLIVNALGQSVGSYDDGEMNIAPQKGADLVTTIDADLQILAEKLMSQMNGGLVAMDPQSGEILSMVSSPQYDVRKLTGRIDSEYWESINTDSLTPLFNRAISSQQPPGSTFKPFMGLVGMHLGIITPDTEIYSTGVYMRGRAYRDLADPGDYDLEKALAMSSNYFFYWMMDQIATGGLLNQWSELIKDFGMGPLNQIDLPFERSGIIPDSTYLNRSFGEKKWGVGDLISLGIGQGLVSVSPLQMAVAASSIANNGFWVQPHLVQSIVEPDGEVKYTNPEREKIEWIRQDHIETVKNGMRRVVIEGSGRFYGNVPDIDVAGKTGTAQNPHGRNHGWFIAFAPADNPEIAVAVLTENSGFGSISAAPVASLLIEKYLKGEIERTNVLNYVLNFEPREEDS